MWTKPLLFFVLSVVILMISFDGLARIFDYHEKNLISTKSDKVLSQQKQRLLRQPDVININWLHTLNPRVKKVRGGVIWSNLKQFGIVSFLGLPKTSNAQRYSLWVYDLEENFDKPILLAKFSVNKKQALIMTVKPDKSITKPYKFELLMEEETALKPYQLLLAQP